MCVFYQSELFTLLFVYIEHQVIDLFTLLFVYIEHQVIDLYFCVCAKIFC